MKNTQTYGLASFEAGDFYNAELDRRRFVTLDYHLKTYVGVVGNGVCTGWEVVPISGLMVRITPGSGFIDGAYSESPYAVDAETGAPIRLSVAQSLGYVIGEQIPGWSSKSGSWDGSFYQEGGSPDENAMVFQQLGPDGEDKNYDGVVDGVLTPRYQAPPPGYFSNPYVKSYPNAANAIILDDDSDTYIFAQKVNLLDPSDTTVKFTSSPTYGLNASNIFLAKVTTRSGAVVSVNSSGSFRLSQGSGPIAEIGKALIDSHTHGGADPTDPAKISLKTDVRSGIPLKQIAGSATYSIIPSSTTGTTEAHNHTFYADASGTGYTISVIGSYESHFHRISGFATTDTTGNYGSTTLTAHSHSIPQTDSTLSQSGTYQVYVNGKVIDSSSYSIDAASASVTFVPGTANITKPTYSCSFQIAPYGGGTGTPRTYSFTQSTTGIQQFLMNLILDFYSTYSNEMMGTDSNGNVVGGYLRSPFTFDYSGLTTAVTVEIDETGNIHTQGWVPITEALPDNTITTPAVSTIDPTTLETTTGIDSNASINEYGYDDVPMMAAMASKVLKKTGDTFTLLPRVGKWITIELIDPGHSDSVVVEILTGVEVKGILPQGNIFFVDS